MTGGGQFNTLPQSGNLYFLTGGGNLIPPQWGSLNFPDEVDLFENKFIFSKKKYVKILTAEKTMDEQSK